MTSTTYNPRAHVCYGCETPAPAGTIYRPRSTPWGPLYYCARCETGDGRGMSEHLNEWQCLTSRYGAHHERRNEAPWRARHCSARADANCSPLAWCICPGAAVTHPPTPCAQKLTQEDALCDECRRWCIGVEPDGRVVQLASVPRVAR